MSERRENARERGRKRQSSRGAYGMCLALSLSLLFLLILGLLLPLRPSYSESEKRKLAELPAPSLRTLSDGSWFRDFSSWYSDTFPFREELLSWEASLEKYYGFQGEAIYSKGERKKESIPETAGETAPTLAFSAPETESAEESRESETAPETDAEGNLILKKQDTKGVHVQGEQAGTVYVTGNCGYELYYFSQENMRSHASLMNTVRSLLPEDISLYSMIVPNSFGIKLSPAVQEKLASSGMDQAISYSYSLMGEKVKRVSIYEELLSHKEEYIYFHTDHHWTQRGAYYAYLVFCKEKGFTPHALSEYQKREYPGFYGSFYFATKRAEALKVNPDTVRAYLPLATNKMHFRDPKGQEGDALVINDANTMSAGNRYSCFLMGDNAFTEIDNPNRNDGSAIALVKDSYGNAFAPFLVDHYQHVYVFDYRYYREDFVAFLREHQVKDVLFLNNIMSLGANSAKEMMGMFH